MAGDGSLYYACGASRSGKSKWIRKLLARWKKILVWDVKDEYARPWNKQTQRPDRTKVLRGWIITRTKKDLIQALTSKHGKNFKICHVPNDLEHFDYWCRCAYQFGMLQEMAIVGEELADVCSAGKAPKWWGQIVRKLLGYGCDIFAITQRPAEADKTSLGNATVIHGCRLTDEADIKTVSRKVRVPYQEYEVLKDGEWIERWSNGELKRGKI